MDRSNHSSSPDIKFSIADKLKKAEITHDLQKAKKELPTPLPGLQKNSINEQTAIQQLLPKILTEGLHEDPLPTGHNFKKKEEKNISLNTVNKSKTQVDHDISSQENGTIIHSQKSLNERDVQDTSRISINLGNPVPEIDTSKISINLCAPTTKIDNSKKSNKPPARRYNIKGSVGQGGMGLINAVEDTTFSRTLAMKVLSPKYIQDEAITKAFIEEAHITAQLQHPNIIPVHDLGVTPETGNQFYTMKLVEGSSLQDVINNLIKEDPKHLKDYNLFNMMSIFKKVCDAVSYAHSKSIIHRDIKPGNIMVGQFGEVLLLDWGLAKHSNQEEFINLEEKLEQSSIDDSMMTVDGIIKGSLAYLSPEQAHGDIKEVDHQTDIFLLGATLYHMLTLQPPYQSNSLTEIIQMAEDASFPHPSKTKNGQHIPEALSNLILKSMAKDKTQRFKSVAELCTKIDDYLQGRNINNLKVFEPGEILIRYEESDNETFIVVSGKVEISRNIDGVETIIETVEKGAVIGELAALTHSLRSATVRALEKTEVMIISKQLMFDEIRKLPPWLEKIVFELASKVSSMNSRIHPFILSNCSLPVMKQLLYIFSMVNTNADNEKTVSISYQGVIHEISQNLGLSHSRIEEVINILNEYKMAEKTHDSRFCINSMNDLKNVIAYIKREQNITEGIGHTFDEIDIEKIPFLDEVYQRVATLHY